MFSWLNVEQGERAPQGRVPGEVPILPLRNVVAYPGVILTLIVGIPRSIKLIEEAVAADSIVGLVAMRDPSIEEPGPSEVYHTGTLARVERVMRTPGGSLQIIVRGLERIRVESWNEGEHLSGHVAPLPEIHGEEKEEEAMRRELLELSRRMAAHIPQIPEEAVEMMGQIQSTDMLVYLVASNLRVTVSEAQEILETDPMPEKMLRLIGILAREIEFMDMGQRIREEAQSEMDKTQKEYYLRQQLKAIQKELGEDDGTETGVEEYRSKLQEAGLPEEAMKEAERELERLRMLPPQSSEVSVIRTYLDWLVDLPWQKLTDDNLDMQNSRAVLNEDHYGLEKVKERILETLAIRKLQLERGIEPDPERASSILCFVGPPGVGKTSLGRSIARALGREFTRMSLGGVRDEAEIRGHRRTYVGAMPGRIIQAIKRVGTRNPVFVLDEVDKIGMDWRGDPSSALLEVLDPQQNHAFRDHYLDVDFDLSQVMFICTANTLSTIPAPLLDRMEVINLDGYTDYDKIHIAQSYLVPRQLGGSGLKPEEVMFTVDGIHAVIRDYTREAGVRNLEREIGRAARKIATQVASGGDVEQPVRVDAQKVRELLGKPKFHEESKLRTEHPGVVTGLAVTPVGGEVLFIEAKSLPGSKDYILTGQLGDVMKESARIALSYVQGEAGALGLDKETLREQTVHLHVPAGAIPKDGPSAGVAMITALVSLLSDIPARPNVGMTGEITLQGQVLPIGGLKQKVLAAHRAGLDTVIFPRRNEVDLDDVPQEVIDEMKLIPVDDVKEALEITLPGLKDSMGQHKEGAGGEGEDKNRPTIDLGHLPPDRPSPEMYN